MKIIRLGKNFKPVKQTDTSSFIATLGNFDGVHLGHQKILQLLREKKQLKNSGSVSSKVKSAVFSFYPHPATVIDPSNQTARVSSLNEVIEQLREFKVDYLFLIHFTKEVASLSTQEFVETYLSNLLNLSELIIGKDAHIGKNREGNPDKIKQVLGAYGVATTILDFEAIEGRKISSRDIRGYIREGNFKRIRELLGRPFVLDGKVAHGAKRGRTIGFPTVNLYIGKRDLPPLGVYASTVEIDGQMYPVALNMGTAPTFNRKKVLIEGHIIGYNGGSLYGRRIKIELVEKIRDIKAFQSVDQLIEQIRNDVAMVEKKILERSLSPSKV